MKKEEFKMNDTSLHENYVRIGAKKQNKTISLILKQVTVRKEEKRK